MGVYEMLWVGVDVVGGCEMLWVGVRCGSWWEDVRADGTLWGCVVRCGWV